MSDKINKNEAACDYKNGPLPSCAPLAVGFVPVQQEGLPKYDAEEALTRGTLFPGLDLPFKNIGNSGMANTPIGELMALDFVTHELDLYLDTHKDDKEAFEMYQGFLKLAVEGRRRYTERYGPISQADMLGQKSFTWINGPWPWEYSERAGG